MTNAAGWTDSDRQKFFAVYQHADSGDTFTKSFGAALSAIGAVRAAPDEPSADIKEVLRRHLGDVLTMQERLDLYKDLRESRLTLAAPGVGEPVAWVATPKYGKPLHLAAADGWDVQPVLFAPDAKPTAPEPEYESVELTLCRWAGEETTFVIETVREAGYKSTHGTELEIVGRTTARFPKPATCKTCGQTKKVAG